MPRYFLAANNNPGPYSMRRRERTTNASGGSRFNIYFSSVYRSFSVGNIKPRTRGPLALSFVFIKISQRNENERERTPGVNRQKIYRAPDGSSRTFFVLGILLRAKEFREGETIWLASSVYLFLLPVSLCLLASVSISWAQFSLFC